MKMKVAVMEDIKKMSVKEMDVPEVGAGEVLVKIYQCNICTTDWQTWAGLRKSQGRKLPWVPGHEMSGEIIEIGENVRPELKVGMHVGFIAQGSRACGECFYCRMGHTSRCLNKPKQIEIDGIEGYFGMAQYFVVNSKRVLKLGDDLPYEEGGYLEPTSTAVHGIKRLRVKPNDNVLVIGAGNLGLVNAQVAKIYGGNVLVSEINEERCKIAQSLGLATINPSKEDIVKRVEEITEGRGMDAVILAVGNTKANDQGIQLLSTMGRILFFASGYPTPELNIDSNKIHYNEYELIGTYGADFSDYVIAADLLSKRLVKVDKMISYKVPINEVQRAFELAATPGNYRVSVSMW